MKDWNLSDFYETEAPAYAAYDNVRSYASYIDGLKVSMRKLYFTMSELYPNSRQKTEPFANTTATHTKYLHGPVSLCGVVDTMAKNFVGRNNFPLLQGNSGGFGNRISPECAAPRYTSVGLSDFAKLIFNKVDNNIVDKQFFEGAWIEPKFFIPVLPYLLLNGSESLSSGWRQKILPRNIEEVANYILKRLKGTKNIKADLLPEFKGFKGKVIRNKEKDTIEVWGRITKKNSTLYIIDEIPAEMKFSSYVDFLSKLEDDKVIQSFKDKSDPKTNEIYFEIKTTREFSASIKTEYDLYKTFKLIANVSEHYNCMDENNRVREFTSIKEILDTYIDFRLGYYQKRKDYLLNNLKQEIKKAISKVLFIKGVNNDTYNVRKMNKKEIAELLEQEEKIVKIDDSYDYLFAMPIYSLTKERIKELIAFIEKSKEEYKTLKATSIENMWSEEIKEILKKVK